MAIGNHGLLFEQMYLVKFLKACHDRLQNFGPVKFVLAITLLSVVADVPMALLFQFVDVSDNNSAGPEWHGRIQGFLYGVLLIPLIETLVFQKFVLWLLIKILKCPSFVAVTVSALIFASMHTYSTAYILLSIFPGLVFAYAFQTLSTLPNRSPVLEVTAAHALRNALAMLIQFFAT